MSSEQLHKHTHENTHGHSHDHEHEHMHGHSPEHEHMHGHTHENGHCHTHRPAASTAHAAKILCIRPQSGLSGDMLLCGLALMLELDDSALAARLQSLNMPELQNCIHIEDRFVSGIRGKSARVDLPAEHAHRTLTDILRIIETGAMPQNAKKLAAAAFTLLAEAEGEIHGKNTADVTFHEVGALDSIADICLACTLFAELAPDAFICGALPLADGAIHCRHGIIPSPAPAVLKLLQGVSVCSFAGTGETVTPTAIALLKTFGAQFGGWPNMNIEKTALVYGGKTFENAPNGSIFVLGAQSTAH